MIKRHEYASAQERAVQMMVDSGLVITEDEKKQVEVVDFGLSNLKVEGAQILTFFNTERVSVKAIALFPNQTEPEHWHTAVGEDPGKEETVRIISGTVYFYIPGEDNMKMGSIPEEKSPYYTVRHELIMKPGDQITIEPGTKHWFQASREGAVMYSFSSCARCAHDLFTDPNIVRITNIVEE